MQSLVFLAAMPLRCLCTSLPRWLGLQARDCACRSDVPSLPPQREKVLEEESPDLSTLWKINFNSCGGIGTKPVNSNWARSWVVVVPILLLPCPENGIIGLLT